MNTKKGIRPVTFAFTSIPSDFSDQPNKEIKGVLVITIKTDLKAQLCAGRIKIRT
jgi:hypothetical protein